MVVCYFHKTGALVSGQIPNIKTEATETDFENVYLTERMTFQVLTAVTRPLISLGT